MSTSEQINELAAALAKAQGEMSNAALNKTNPHFKSRYADLAAIRDATNPALTKNGLAITQYTETIAAGMLLHTRLMHSSGQWIEGNYPIAADITKPQATGSALTYAKRYSWAGMCGIASEEDDDANAAQDAAKANGVQPGEQRFVYQRLVNTLRSTKDDAGVDEWKERNNADVNTLDDSYFAMLKQAVNDHRLSFKGAAVKAPKKEPSSSKALPPMPEDDLGAAS